MSRLSRFAKYVTVWVALLFMGLSFNACEKDTPDCFEPTSVLSRLSFVIKDSIHVDTLIDSVYVDTSIVKFRDTLFKSPVMMSLNMPQNLMVYGSSMSNFMGFPFNPDSGRMVYALQYDTTRALRDTLTYFYHSSVHFISNACGFTHFYHIDSVQTTRNLIDSFIVNEREVTDKASDRHVTLYFFNQ